MMRSEENDEWSTVETNKKRTTIKRFPTLTNTVEVGSKVYSINMNITVSID